MLYYVIIKSDLANVKKLGIWQTSPRKNQPPSGYRPIATAKSRYRKANRGNTTKGATTMTNKGQEYGREIAQKMLELQQAFRGELNTHNDIYAEYKAEGVYEDTIAAELSENDEFIEEYLHDEVMALAKAVLSADWYGLYVAGFVPAAKSYEEYREKEAKQTREYNHDINKTLRSFEDFMEEHKNSIF